MTARTGNLFTLGNYMDADGDAGLIRWADESNAPDNPVLVSGVGTTYPLVGGKTGTEVKFYQNGKFDFSPGALLDELEGTVSNPYIYVAITDGKDAAGNPDSTPDRVVKVTFPVTGTMPANNAPTMDAEITVPEA